MEIVNKNGIIRKIAVCGSPEFVVKFFDFVANSDDFEVVCAITQVAKKANRGEIAQTAVAKWAAANSIPCFEIDRIKGEDHTQLEAILSEIDCVLIFAFGKIIPQKWLDLPKHGWLNVHPSRLPQFRGPTPLHAAILGNLEKSAISLMKINARMDEGNLIAQQEFEIENEDTTQTLMQKLQTSAPAWVAENMRDFIDGKIQDYEQIGQASYCSLIQKSDYRISSEDQTSAQQILLKIRAYGFVFLNIDGIEVKCFKAKLAHEKSALIVNGIEPLLLQKPGKTIVDLKSFLNGIRK